jgi:peptidoglycan/xylan/chitin deacetylase (PgdA/CDA1 family)
VLNILKQYNARATFFCIGDNVNKHPDIYKQVLAAGHRIGNHTYNHLKGWRTDDETYADNFLKCDELLQNQPVPPAIWPYQKIADTAITKHQPKFRNNYVGCAQRRL